LSRPRNPLADLALDADAVLPLVAALVRTRVGFEPGACEPTALKRTERRIVVRYRLSGDSRTVDVVGKWYGTDRGAIVEETLEGLRDRGFSGRRFGVPEPLGYLPDLRVLFTEAISGPILRETLRDDPSSTARAGAWLATFHRSGMSIPRDCGSGKQRAAVARWAREIPELVGVAPVLDAALAEAPDPGLAVHYDYYHSQIILDGPRTVVLDLDEAGMGDPAFDLAHFDAHIRLLALQWLARPDGLDEALGHFRSGYASVAPQPPRHPALDAFAWYKLAYQARRRGAPRGEQDYTLEAVRGSLSAA